MPTTPKPTPQPAAREWHGATNYEASSALEKLLYQVPLDLEGDEALHLCRSVLDGVLAVLAHYAAVEAEPFRRLYADAYARAYELAGRITTSGHVIDDGPHAVAEMFPELVEAPVEA